MTPEEYALLLRKIARGLMKETEDGLALIRLFNTEDDDFDDWLCWKLAEYYDYE